MTRALLSLFLLCAGCEGASSAADGGLGDASSAATDASQDPRDAGAESADHQELPPPDAGDARPPLLYGVVEEQLALCYTGQGYPCPTTGQDTARRGKLKTHAPGLTVRWGGFETEETGFGYPGNAARRAFENVAGDGQLEPAFLIDRAKAAGFGAWLIAFPVTQTTDKVPGGVHVWTAEDAENALEVWKGAIEAGGFPPPAYIEIGNEPWLYSSGSDGFRNRPAEYVARARPIAQAIRAKLLSFGWPTRLAVVVDAWPGTSFETVNKAGDFPAETIAFAKEIAVNGPPVLQTHGYPLHSGYWCPKPRTAAGEEAMRDDVACVYALYTMLQKIKSLAPEADLILTEDNYDATDFARANVYSTLAPLLTFAAGGVVYTHFGNNHYGANGARYELFDGAEPVELVKTTMGKVVAALHGARRGDVKLLSTSGAISIGASGYKSLVNASTAPAPYQNGSAPAAYTFQVGDRQASVDLNALTVTWQP